MSLLWLAWRRAFPTGCGLRARAWSAWTLQRITCAAEFGLRQLRVRDHWPVARIEIPEQDLTADLWSALMAADARKQLVAQFKALGYTYVTLDLAGFRSGSMNETLTSSRSSAGKVPDEEQLYE